MENTSPLWKQLFDRAERVVGPALDGLVRTDEFAAFTALGQRGFIEIDRRLENTSRRLWHRLNLPAGSDINRLLEHIARLERHVSDLEHQLTDRENAEYLASLTARHELRSADRKRADAREAKTSRGASRSRSPAAKHSLPTRSGR